MRTFTKFITLGLLLLTAACNNDNDQQNLQNEPVIVREVKGASDLFIFDLLSNNTGLLTSYIVPGNTLSEAYKQDGLPVSVSGTISDNTVAVNGYIVDGAGGTITLNGRYNTFEITAMSESLEIPFTEYLFAEYSIWKYTGHNGEVIELTFYPENKIHINSTPEELGFSYLMGGNIIIDYYIDKDRMYWSDSDGKFHEQFFWNITCLSENKVVLRYGGYLHMTPRITTYLFIRQPK